MAFGVVWWTRGYLECWWLVLLSWGLFGSLSTGLKSPDRLAAAGIGDSCLSGDVLPAKGTGKASV